MKPYNVRLWIALLISTYHSPLQAGSDIGISPTDGVVCNGHETGVVSSIALGPEELSYTLTETPEERCLAILHTERIVGDSALQCYQIEGGEVQSRKPVRFRWKKATALAIFSGNFWLKIEVADGRAFIESSEFPPETLDCQG